MLEKQELILKWSSLISCPIRMSFRKSQQKRKLNNNMMKKLIPLFPLILTLLVISCTNPNNTDNNNQMDQPIDTARSEEHTSELQSRENIVCRLLLEKKKIINIINPHTH